MAQVYRVALILAPQPEGGYTVTSPVLPGLVTQGDWLEQALENVEDALRATLELYEDTGRPMRPPARWSRSRQPPSWNE